MFLAAIFLAIIGIVGYFIYENNFKALIPAEAKKLVNPIAPSAAVLQASKPVYLEQCANCHGETGKGNGPDAMMYDPSPSDFTDAAAMAKFTDGEFFYQITEGKKPMPSFKKRLTQEQRWQLVLFVRSFSKK
jgi:mono/diheme cytochrome c family protein